MARYLVTGGAGFVGSMIVARLLDLGASVVVLDDLSLGHRDAVLPGAGFVRGDVGDREVLDAILSDGPWDGVLHFASLSLVGESMREPMRYLLRNGMCGLTLIDACVRHGVRRFVLSSTANLFGPSAAGVAAIDEATTVDPASPYAESKQMLERALLWADRLHGLRSACLRYFNAAGADPAGRVGEDHEPETHLIPLAIDSALGRRPPLAIFGTDYPTPDGTCLRDYIHVADLADAHLGALGVLDRGSVTYNVGTGSGHSVREVVDAVGRVAGRRVPVVEQPRRPGDPASLVAASDRLRAETGWEPRRTKLDDVVGDAFRWRLRHPDGYGDKGRRPAASHQAASAVGA